MSILFLYFLYILFNSVDALRKIFYNLFTY
uniref:Uncharacterized protein n=1 Tax=Myoviridae sp. ct8mY9 TaxID=2827664 RepID=A0A8S5SFH2_9CAUD|nr:MAG TPA: hypothetical protein [Myoviridae sp. ct8mY9]